MQKIQKMMEMMQQNSKSKKSRRRQNLTKYCQTQGLCNHSSPECQTPDEGHKMEATLQNLMGGSTRNIT